MSLSTGAILDYSMAAHKGRKTGEFALLRAIFDSCIVKNDILLGDRYYPSFFVMADLKAKEADGLFRGHYQRCYDFRKGKSLGKKDHIVPWKKPSRPEWMDKKTYDAYPRELQIREFKVNGSVYVTTFLDSKKCHKKELVKVYERRWEVEITLKHIKSTMNMDVLTCKTPDMLKKEIGIHFLAYNCIRIIMMEACLKHEALPWKISFKGSIQLINNWAFLFLNSGPKEGQILYEKLLKLIVKNKVGNRPGRVEPRAIKTRERQFPRLWEARAIWKKRVKKKIEKMVLKNKGA